MILPSLLTEIVVCLDVLPPLNAPADVVSMHNYGAVAQGSQYALMHRRLFTSFESPEESDLSPEVQAEALIRSAPPKVEHIVSSALATLVILTVGYILTTSRYATEYLTEDERVLVVAPFFFGLLWAAFFLVDLLAQWMRARRYPHSLMALLVFWSQHIDLDGSPYTLERRLDVLSAIEDELADRGEWQGVQLAVRLQQVTSQALEGLRRELPAQPQPGLRLRRRPRT